MSEHTPTPTEPISVPAAEPGTTYQFLVPGHIAVSVPATSEAEARELLEQKGRGTLELDHLGPLQVGGLAVHTIDLVPIAAQVDKAGEESTADSLPADFSISDIARVAARLLGDGWTASAGTWAVSGELSHEATATHYTLEVVEGTLQLLNEKHDDTTATFKPTASLGTIAAQVARAVQRDIEHG
ncbi:hypothetical protein ACFV2V_25155 [Streptomyces sp. NPDC059698]|nr:hypothetical protein [Streptomyces sp. CB02366]